ncbi:MAG: SMI1/KNR4 family protein [Prosthecobacter sp.]
MKLPGFDPTHIVATGEIDGVELVLRVKFPPLYRQLLLEFQGSHGDAEFPVPGTPQPASIGLWLSFSPWAVESAWTYLSTWREHQLMPELVPIATDGGGNLLCLHYRGAAEPEVVLWYHELEGTDGLHFVAETFSDFLATLREPSP